MNNTFLRYFSGYIFRAKTRQKLLILAAAGLFLSSFALIVLHSVMGGLQKGLVQRSKYWMGNYTIVSRQIDNLEAVETFLKTNNISKYSKEIVVEVLMRRDGHVSPIVLHGVFANSLPPYLDQKDINGVVLGTDLASKLRAGFGSDLKFIAPMSVDYLIGEVPRQVTDTLSDFVMSELSEVDLFHGWVRAGLIQNLLRKRGENTIRIYQQLSSDQIEKLKENFPNYIISSWESKNSSLVWALNLETSVMLSLFIVMTILVGVCITSGYLIFFSKVKQDFMSFWILGLSRKRIDQLASQFCYLISFVSCLSGLIIGLLFLFLLDKYGLNIMPDVFVERSIPVNISGFGVLISLCVPLIIATVFSRLSLSWSLKERAHFLKLLRSAGS